MIDQKPLPAIPAFTPLSTLSVDARRHRSRLIQHFLSEIHEPGIESRRNRWVVVLEGALDELGQCLSKEGWLNGIKRSRQIWWDAKKRKQEADREAQLQNATKISTRMQKDTTEGLKQSKGQDTITHSSLASVEQFTSSSMSISMPGGKRLLLFVAPPSSSNPVPAEDSGFDIVPANIGCIFSPGRYTPRFAEAPAVLFGGSNWEAPLRDSDAQFIGGTFTFKGINSQLQYHHLFEILQISTYVHLSLILEQHLLADSNVPLVFPTPKISILSPPVPTRTSTQTSEPKQKKHSSFLPAGILSFFSPKGNMNYRSRTIMPIIGRGGSLDLGIPLPRPASQDQPLSRPSLESGINGFSRLSRHLSVKEPAQSVDEPKTPFLAALNQVQDSCSLLSTSPGVSFSPPTLIVDLAKQEKEGPIRRLKGDQKTGLLSILGWEGKENVGKGMSGSLGFLRQQGFSVLVSRHLPWEVCNSESEITTSTSSSLSSSSSPSPESTKAGSFMACGRAVWQTYRYYSSDADEDMTLGEAILDFVHGARLPCSQPGCRSKQGQHELRFIHNGVYIAVNITKQEEQVSTVEDEHIEVWESCAICSVQSKRNKMMNGTHLLSFGKFLELLVYSPALCFLKHALCEHIIPPPYPWPNLPVSRFNIIRHFSTQSYTVLFSTSANEDVFELRVPRFQLVRGSGDMHSRESAESIETRMERVDSEEEKKELRREIRRWWASVADYMDKLELIFASNDEAFPWSKALPRLPSDDDGYSNMESAQTPKSSSINLISGLPPTTPIKESLSGPSFETPIGASAPPPTPLHTPNHPAFVRLSSLRQTFHRTEQTLYAQLSRTPVALLNETRRSFIASAKGAEKRLYAWQKKHISTPNHTIPECLTVEEPEWWGERCHAVPGSNVIVREDDWGSIIAFTLSTADYHRELANMSIARLAPNTQPQPPASEVSPAPSNQSSFFSAAMGYKLFTTSSQTQPDPDLDDVTWSETEIFSSVISRKEHPRDPISLLEVLRTKSPAEGLTASRFGSLGSFTQRPNGSAPPSAWARPEVQISMDEADGRVILGDTTDSADKILHEFESALVEASSRPSSRTSGSIRYGKAPSITSAESDTTIGKDYGNIIRPSTAPPLPLKDDPHSNGRKPQDLSDDQVQAPASPTRSSFTSSLTNGLSHAIRFMRGSNDTLRPASPFSKSHHGLLSAEVANIDDRPHIKYDWTIGKRLKFSCTVYYARQFDILRRRCGIDSGFVTSLSRSVNWAADGGKSKSNFWKTADDRFIIKTLVNAWNVADLQVLIELAPSYFRYMDATASRATILAKMIGFYTIEIRNLETGTVQSKADLLIMENLFYKQKVAKTFDLKGIQGRKVSNVKTTQNSKTLFDGEWIEGQQKALLLVRPHSKHVLRTAIRNDAEFLTKSNIMDYSLLVGVNEERKEIACGLVDTIGSYTFAKTLEYKAKQGLTSGKDITVMPPAEYQERFVNALEGYFLACPDKWSKPMDESKVTNDASHLPSVL